MQSDCVGRGDDGPTDDVVSVQEGACDWFSDAIDVYGGCANKGNDKTNCSCKQRRNHEDSKPTDIETVVSRGNPVTKEFPVI